MSQKPIRLCLRSIIFWLQVVQFSVSLNIYEVDVKGMKRNSFSSTIFVWKYIFRTDECQQHRLERKKFM